MCVTLSPVIRVSINDFTLVTFFHFPSFKLLEETFFEEEIFQIEIHSNIKKTNFYFFHFTKIEKLREENDGKEM